jgi:hypothetical protein
MTSYTGSVKIENRIVQMRIDARNSGDAMAILRSHGELFDGPREVRNGPHLTSLGNGVINDRGQVNLDRVLLIPLIIMGVIYKTFGWVGVAMVLLTIYVFYFMN